MLPLDSDCCNGSVSSRGSSLRFVVEDLGPVTHDHTCPWLGQALGICSDQLQGHLPWLPYPNPTPSPSFFLKPIFFIGHIYVSIHLSLSCSLLYWNLNPFQDDLPRGLLSASLPLFPSPSLSPPSNPHPYWYQSVSIKNVCLKFNLLGSDSCSVIY